MSNLEEINKIVEEKLLNDIDIILEYEKVSVYQGFDGCIEYIQQLTGCDRNMAIQIINEHEELKPSNESSTDYEYRHTVANAQARELLNKPKCPTCQSTNISKIGGLERGASIAAFGIFSKKINKTFKCGNCGYTW